MRKSSKNLEKQLLAYSTAAGAVLAVAPSSDAAVIVTNINVTMDFGSSNSVVLAASSVNRFKVSLNIVDLPVGSSWQRKEYLVIAAQTAGAFWRRAGASSALNLAFNAPVKAGNWSNNVPGANWNMVYAKWTASAKTQFFAPNYKYGAFTNSGYLGLRFYASGITNYGWASVTVTPNLHSITIGQFAYDNTGVDLPAGVIPEPTSLSLLALGAAGVLAFRRSRKNVKP
jgi:hypothetical protein